MKPLQQATQASLELISSKSIKGSKIDRYHLDINTNRIDLLDTRFYELNGEYYPSVTTILDAYPKGFAYFQWLKDVGDKADEIRDAFGDRGSVVHRLTEMYDKGLEVCLLGTEGKPQYTAIEWAMFERYVEFQNRFNPEILCNELNLVDAGLGYGGTLDRLIRMDGKVYLIDIKTGNNIHNHFWLQMAAYKKLFYTLNPGLLQIDEIGILWLNAKTRTDGKKGTIQGKGWQLMLPEKSTEDYLNLFNATHTLWKVENEGMKPKNLSYQIVHHKLI